VKFPQPPTPRIRLKVAAEAAYFAHLSPVRRRPPSESFCREARTCHAGHMALETAAWSADTRELSPAVYLRTGAAAATAGLVCGVGCWALSGQYASSFWLIPLVLVPSALAGLAVGSIYGRVWACIGTAAALLACALAVMVSWTPEPALFGGLRAQEAAATSTADAAIAAHPGTCSPPDTADLGSLAALGPWDKVCVYGTSDGSIRGLQLIRPPGSTAPGLLYSATGDSPVGTPTMSSGCVRRIEGNWWADRSPNRSDPTQPCPRQYTYMPND
jgi:hypothetical protein